MTAPIRSSVHSDSGGSSVTTLTSGTLSSYIAKDLLFGVGFSSLASNQFASYTWSNGDTNTNQGLSPSSTPSCSLNSDAPASNGSTTFGFTCTSSALSVIAVDLIPANSSVAPTVNATSKANSSITGTGASPALGTYTTSAGDCIFFAVVSNTGNGPITMSGAGATWTSISGVNGSSHDYWLFIGYNCSSGQTSCTFSSVTSTTYRYALVVFSGVATSGVAASSGNMLALL